MKTSKILKLSFVLLLWMPLLSYATNTLTLENAIKLALDNDSIVKAYQQQSSAFNEYSVAADSWADPRIKFGVLSLPTDSLELDQEPMTQLVLGYQQMLPRGDSAEYQSAHLQAQAKEKQADLRLRQRKVKLKTTKAWLQVYLHEKSEKIIRENRRLFKQQLNVSQSLYASGRNQQQDVLQAELELSLVDDQLHRVKSEIKESRALLARWVGTYPAGLPLKTDENQFLKIQFVDMAGMVEKLRDYPLLEKFSAQEEVGRQKVEVIRQKYKPQWGFDLTYGKRSGDNMDGSERADFVSAIVNFDLPVFTDQKQDRELSASKKQLLATQYKKQDVYVQTVAQLEQAFVKWQQLKDRVDLYDQQVLQQAKQNAAAALNGYQSGVVTFFTLTRARSAELKAQLQSLKLIVERAMALADIHYLIGDK